MSEVLHGILDLAEVIRDEFGIYVSPTFHLHEGTTYVSLLICTGYDGDSHTFHRIEGEASDIPTDRQSLDDARDDLLEWIVEHRKEQEAA